MTVFLSMTNKSLQSYKKTRFGWLMPGVLLAMIPISWNYLLIPDAPLNEYMYLLFLNIVVLILAILFSTVTLRATSKRIEFYFGPYFLLQSIPLLEIATIEETSISWFRSFGVSRTKTGVVYALAGGKATKLVLKNGRIIIVGIPFSQNLARIIHQEN